MAPYKTLPYYQFVLLQKDEAVVLRSVDPATGMLSTELWIFALRPLDAGTTRLVVRHRNTEQPGTFGYYITKLVFDPMAFIMERGMMRGIRSRAEG